jgi:hypothetical protein
MRWGDERTMKQPKAKKRRPTTVRLDPQPGWNLDRHIRVTIAHGAPTPAWVDNMLKIRTDNQGGPR